MIETIPHSALSEEEQAAQKEVMGMIARLHDDPSNIQPIIKIFKNYPRLLNATDEIGRTPLLSAINYGQAKAVHWLTFHGGDLRFQKYDQTYHAIYNNSHRTAFISMRVSKSPDTIYTAALIVHFLKQLPPLDLRDPEQQIIHDLELDDYLHFMEDPKLAGTDIVQRFKECLEALSRDPSAKLPHDILSLYQPAPKIAESRRASYASSQSTDSDEARADAARQPVSRLPTIPDTGSPTTSDTSEKSSPSHDSLPGSPAASGLRRRRIHTLFPDSTAEESKTLLEEETANNANDCTIM